MQSCNSTKKSGVVSLFVNRSFCLQSWKLLVTCDFLAILDYVTEDEHVLLLLMSPEIRSYSDAISSYELFCHTCTGVG